MGTYPVDGMFCNGVQPFQLLFILWQDVFGYTASTTRTITQQWRQLAIIVWRYSVRNSSSVMRDGKMADNIVEPCESNPPGSVNDLSEETKKEADEFKEKANEYFKSGC